MEFDRNHIVSRGYIRNWAVGDAVACEFVPGGRRLSLAPSQVCVRSKFYARSPTAEGVRTAAAAERARGSVENMALPLLGDLVGRWPLEDGRDRAWVALWVAMTLCGSPRSRREIPRNTERFFAHLDRERPIFAGVTAGHRGEFSEPDYELDAMFAEVSTVASVIGQMHWTLLTFGRPALVSSDHPITRIRWTRDRQRDVGAPDLLLLDSSEVRLPIGPRAALLLTWADADDRVEVKRAARHHIGLLNRGAWVQAERHRFWQPGTTPSGVDDRRAGKPIARELFRGYDPERSSLRLDVALEWCKRRRHGQLATGPIGGDDRAVVTTWFEQGGSGGPRIVAERHDREHAEAFADFVL
ncbi:MAG TPA: DUF4238 domain-containing protein [Conexibacter sp.]